VGCRSVGAPAPADQTHTTAVCAPSNFSTSFMGLASLLDRVLIEAYSRYNDPTRSNGSCLQLSGVLSCGQKNRFDLKAAQLGPAPVVYDQQTAILYNCSSGGPTGAQQHPKRRQQRQRQSWWRLDKHTKQQCSRRRRRRSRG